MRTAGRCQHAEPEALSFLAAGDLQIDFAHRRVTLAGNEVHLTPIEYEILCTLALHEDRVLTHRQLLMKVWRMDGAEQHHKLCVHVANLRRKIEPDPARPRLLRTEPGIGYRFGDARRSPPAVYGNAGPPNG